MPTNSTGSSTYPYLIGPSYYGTPDTSNIGPNSGKITITETVTTYYFNSSSASNNVSITTTTTTTTQTTTNSTKAASTTTLSSATTANSSITQNPLLKSWKKSNGTGYSGITADVDKVQYSANYVYVHTSGIPSYSIGPWPNNPNTPKNMNSTFRITLNPTVASTKTATPMGHIGILINGVALYNPQDGYSYNNLGTLINN